MHIPLVRLSFPLFPVHRSLHFSYPSWLLAPLRYHPAQSNPQLTHHSDVLRRRFQINSMNGMGFQYTGIADAVASIVRQEGPRGLYKGIVPNLLKVAPSMASSWASYEFVRDSLVKYGRDD